MTLAELTKEVAALKAAFEAEKLRHLDVESQLIWENIEFGRRFWELLWKYEPERAKAMVAQRQAEERKAAG